MAKDRLGIDFETYCGVSLPKVGVSRYTRHASAEVLMAAWSFNDVPQRQWIPAEGEPMPKMLKQALQSPDVEKWAWNAAFEVNATQNILKIPMDIRQWKDTMVLALSCSLPGKLEKAGPVVDLGEDKQKAAKGTRLIKKFSSPRKPTKNNPATRLHWFDDLPDWEEYKDYNRQDEVAERAIYHKLIGYDMPQHEWDMWHIDQDINQEGLPINRAMMRNAITIYETLVRQRLEEMKDLTGLDNPNSGAQLLPWLQEYGYPFDDLKGGHIDRAIEREIEETGDTPNNILLTVLRLRAEVSRTSPKKFHALQRATDDDGRLRYAFQFAGAARTWRWAGRIYQPQNLPRPTKMLEKGIVTHAKNVEFLDAESIDLIYGDGSMDLLASCVRPVVQAPPGYTFVDVDLNAIENRVLGWLANCPKILDVFRKGLDPYLAFAVYMYGIPYHELEQQYKNGDGSRRTIAKPGVLGCFGSNTPVLTDKGWKRIVDIREDDLVHDGVEFVTHGGVAYRGEQQMLCRSGVYVTPDHRVEVEGDWLAWDQAIQPKMFGRALNSAIGKLSRSFGRLVAQEKSTDAAAHVGWKQKFRDQILCGGFQLGVPGVLQQIAGRKSGSESEGGYMTFSRIVSTLRDLGAKKLETNISSITEVGEFVCGSGTPMRGYPIASMSLAQTERSKSTGPTMMGTTSRKIFDSLPDPSRTETSAPSWDIVNVGTRSSFVVLTENGPVVVHNCGYMLGAGDVKINYKTGEKEGTGLLGYAWNMGVKQFTKDESQLSVDTFRREFEEVTDYWYGIENAAKQCIRQNKEVVFGHISFDRKGPFMRMNLPSGRSLHYLRPRLEETMMPWGKKKMSITYEGQNDKKMWTRQSTHPGKLTENADQAISRDLLAHGIKLARKEGIRIPLHVHDQIVGLVKEDVAEERLAILKECMSDVPRWAPKLPLGVAGHITPIFIKD